MWCYSKIKSPEEQPESDDRKELTEDEYARRLARAEAAGEEARRVGREMDAVTSEHLSRRLR
ncbi:MAG: hypothetical protein EA398_14120 [Deltaproteobacteria bacterium]|nr:MAG: hypothetical protein EA398_14120 [Deltaproteobacteria bacterium]